MANLNQVFHKKAEPKCYLKQLDPSEQDERALKEAKFKVREALREGLHVATEMKFGPGKGVRPRFFTQGSWAYKTCNAPCQPHQEMDLDIGVYLPMENWEDEEVTPSEAAYIYFKMVEESLKPLAKREGWTFDNKPTCVRLKLNNGIKAHIDVPLYVAPKKEFEQIKEEYEQRAVLKSLNVADASVEFSEQEWSDLNHIALATRDDGWKLSDPRRVANYFKARYSQDNGAQLRRICRYLKGARDHRFANGGPSSILLMVCASWDWKNQSDRDDIALLNVLEKLGDRLQGAVIEPSIDPGEDLNRIPSDERAAVKQWANGLYHALKGVIMNREPDNAASDLSLLQGYLDHRIPDEVSLIVWLPDAPEIISTPSRVRPQPQNHEVTSG
ncbi:CBASS cGAMP synthase [Halomonas heilongjiangensis]|uniref:CBASS cGAMP synthase n=1 Tax=Halomonas heilongjiangensis TaxID=1387883 RepID=UPI0011AFC6C7|nr:hypothetical protein [Halomonas heilongjiangensis]